MRVLLALAASGLLIALVPSIRTPILQATGGLLIVNDPVEPVDVAVMTEASEAGELELSDLFHDRVTPRVMILTAAPTTADLDLVRRGVRVEDVRVTRLLKLGIPPDAIMTVEAGEGGTTEGTEALAAWVADHPSRVLVVVSPTHTRRYRRALRRMWPANVPPPRVRYPRAATFRAEDWWESRRTLRDGVFELQKLAWDVLRHPW
jgi:hypothetical protein